MLNIKNHQNNFFLFASDSDKIVIDGAFVAKISKHVSSKEELLSQYKESLMFPSYFGFNWDALYDCLCDLTWIENSKIQIIHSELPKLEIKILNLYLNLLLNVLKVWENDSLKSIEIIFDLKDKTYITNILKEELK